MAHAIRTTIEELLSKFSILQETYPFKIIAALIVTLISVFAITLLSKLNHKK